MLLTKPLGEILKTAREKCCTSKGFFCFEGLDRYLSGARSVNGALDILVPKVKYFCAY
jgi:hypothetical protein